MFIYKFIKNNKIQAQAGNLEINYGLRIPILAEKQSLNPASNKSQKRN
jgi:hypothetical protein